MNWQTMLTRWQWLFTSALIAGSALAQKGQPLIVYNVCVDVKADNYDVFIMNMDGSNKRNLSRWKGVDWVYYAHGDRIYFLSDRAAKHRQYHLYEMDSNGANIRQITTFLLEDSWLSSRKNGSEFVVSSAVDGPRHELYLIDRNGKRLKRLTDNQIYENDPHFSPNGEALVFRSKASGIDELWVMNLASGKTRQLTHYPREGEAMEKQGYRAGPPFWEPNRNLISYTSTRGGKYSIYTIRPDGSDPQQLITMKGNQVFHAWSDDGRYLAFDSTDEEGHYDIYLMTMADKSVRRLTDSAQYEQAPVFVQPAGD